MRLEAHLKRDIMEAQGDAKAKAFCRWIDIAIALRKKHNYEGYFLVITNLSLIDKITESEDFPKSYLKAYIQLLEHADPSSNFVKLRTLWNKDTSPNKLKATFYWSKELTNLNEQIESVYSLEVRASMLREKIKSLLISLKSSKVLQMDRRFIRAIYRNIWKLNLHRCRKSTAIV